VLCVYHTRCSPPRPRDSAEQEAKRTVYGTFEADSAAIMADANLDALLEQQKQKGEVVKKLKTDGVTGAELTAALDELGAVKKQILPILEAQYNAETDAAKKEALATRVRGYMDKKQQKIFDKQRKKMKKAAAAAASAEKDAAGNGDGGEKKLTKKQLAKLERKRKKEAAIAARKAAGGNAKGGKQGAASAKGGPTVHFSWAENAPKPLISFIGSALSSTSSPNFEATLQGAQKPTFKTSAGQNLRGDFEIARAIAPDLYPEAARASIDELVKFAESAGKSPEALSAALGTANAYLETRTFLADGSTALTLADIAVFVVLDGHGIKNALDDLSVSIPYLVRWYTMCRGDKAFTSVRKAGWCCTATSGAHITSLQLCVCSTTVLGQWQAQQHCQTRPLERQSRRQDR